MLERAQFVRQAVAAVIGAARDAWAARPKIKVSQWAEQNRQVAKGSSPRPGPWRNATFPFLAEVMDLLTPSDPARKVVAKKAAQMGFTDSAICWIFCLADLYPGPIGLYLPTIDLSKGYNRTKLNPAIEATIGRMGRPLFATQKDRAADGSTQLFKAFVDGFLMISGANASNAFQMFSFKYLIKDEVSEWPADCGGRGDPYQMSENRLDSFADESKIYEVSTPGIKGECRITKAYEASDQRRFYLACPQCGEEQILEWRNFRYNETYPHEAHFVCSANGCVIEHRHKSRMLRAGRWIAEQPGPGRDPGFAIWQAYHPIKSWDRLAVEWTACDGDPEKERVFTQQVLGEPYEVKGEAPEIEALLDRREAWRRGTIPASVVFLTMGCDVQGDRLEWAVYGWGFKLSSWPIDFGKIMGDPEDEETWGHLAEVIERQFFDVAGRPWKIDAVGIDSGYLSQTVYRFAMQWPDLDRVFAVDGRAGWNMSPLGASQNKAVNFEGKKVGGVQLWPVYTWGLKSGLYGALRKTLRGPDEDGVWRAGAMHLPEWADKGYLEELTAEHLVMVQTRRGTTERHWRVKRGLRNEQHDMAVYARAMAHHLSDALLLDEWMDLAAKRLAEPKAVQADILEALRRPFPGGPTGEVVGAEAETIAPDADEDWLGDRVRENWLDRG